MKQLLGKSNALEMGKREGSEIKSGGLCLVQNINGKMRKITVFVRVYKSSFEHYAVLYKDQKFCLQSGYISLKNCLVNLGEQKNTELRVTLNDFEGTGLTFETDTRAEAEDWAEALHPQILSSSPPKSSISPSLSPVIPRLPLMPTLEEADEDV